MHYQHCRDVSKASSRCLPDMREDLESGLERLLECSSQRLSKLEEIRPRGYSRAQKGTGPPPEISRDKAFQSKVTLGEVSREPFQTSGEPTEGFCQMSPRYHETLEQVRVGLNVSRYVYLLEMFRQCQANLFLNLSRIQAEPLAYLGAYQTVQRALEDRRANILSQQGDRISYGVHLPLMLPQMAREDGHGERKTVFPLQKQGRCRVSAI